MQNVNYQRILDSTIARLSAEGKVPTLLLHSCCAPCSSYCLEYLSNYFHITVFYYNPNIYPAEEYAHRVAEQQNLIAQMPAKYPVSFIEGVNDPAVFYNMVSGYESLKEGGARCFLCYEMRLRETAMLAKKQNFDYFTTTLTLSPLKNSAKINEIGEKLSKEFDVNYLFSDFKKRGGYLRSIELSKQYNIYRQNYCGCEFSQKFV